MLKFLENRLLFLLAKKIVTTLFSVQEKCFVVLNWSLHPRPQFLSLEKELYLLTFFPNNFRVLTCSLLFDQRTVIENLAEFGYESNS